MDADELAEANSQLFATIVASANGNQAVMDGTTEPIKAIIDAGEVVFALWPEPRNECGIGLLILKGERRLAECVAAAQPFRVCGVICCDSDAAIAADFMFGVHEMPH